MASRAVVSAVSGAAFSKLASVGGNGLMGYFNKWWQKGSTGLTINDLAAVSANASSKHVAGVVAGSQLERTARKSAKDAILTMSSKELGKGVTKRGYGKVSDFVPTEMGAQSTKYVNKYADKILEVEAWVGKGTWPHKPLRVVEVDGKKLVLDGHHRLEAAKKVSFSGSIPSRSVPVANSGYTMEQLRQFIK